jgi:hypothetical protein
MGGEVAASFMQRVLEQCGALEGFIHQQYAQWEFSRIHFHTACKASFTPELNEAF